MAEAPPPPPDPGAAESPATANAKTDAATKGAGGILLGGDIEIRADRRLPQYDSGEVKAYAAFGKGHSDPRFFALICEPHLTPRIQAASLMPAFVHPSFARLARNGVVFWPPAKAQRYVFVYENTLGNPLVAAGRPAALGMRQEDLLESLIRPMVGLLTEFHNKDFVHGGFRASNLFDGGSSALGRVILGECLSGPVASAQPALYETIERAMVAPQARGLGTQASDFYALGVCLAVLLRHSDPLEGLSEREVLERKIEEGSYAALTGKDRFTGSVLELLRGLLYDDPAQRWSLADVQLWLDGQRLSPKQSVKKLKAARHIPFNGEKYLRPQLLALDLGNNLPDAAEMIESGNLIQWLVRSLDDKPTLERVEKAVESLEELGKGPGHWDRLACRVSIALDPEAPIRYKGLAVHPEGIGNALAYAVASRWDLAPFAEMILQNTILFWLDSQSQSAAVDIGSLMTRFDSCRAFLRQKNMGYGIERCLYLLNSETHCLSEKLSRFFVRSPEDLLTAFEEMIVAGDAPVQFFDRHILAFLSVKDRKVIDAYLPDFNGDEKSKQVLATLKALATIQKRSRMPPFPRVAKHLASLMDPIYEHYHDRQLRETIREKIGKLKDGGDLARMAALFENPDVPQKDFGAFRRAMRDYAALRQEKGRIEKAMVSGGDFGKSMGRQVAALTSSVVAGIIIVIVALVRLGGQAMQ